MISPQSLYESPNAISGDYQRFRVSERLLLSGHSHQAWPDCAFDAQAQAWVDAAQHGRTMCGGGTRACSMTPTA